MQLVPFGAEDTQPACTVFVAVAFKWAIAVIFDFVHLCGQHHADSKPRQEDHAGISDSLNRTVDLTIAMDGPLDINIQEFADRIGGDSKMGAEGDLFAADKDLGIICPGDRAVITAVLPFDPDFTVIVGRRTPDVVLHRLAEEGRLVEHHLPEGAGRLVIDIAEVAAAKNDDIIIFADLDLVFLAAIHQAEFGQPLTGGVAITENDLVKAKLVAFVQQFGCLFEQVDKSDSRCAEPDSGRSSEMLQL